MVQNKRVRDRIRDIVMENYGELDNERKLDLMESALHTILNYRTLCGAEEAVKYSYSRVHIGQCLASPGERKRLVADGPMIELSMDDWKRVSNDSGIYTYLICGSMRLRGEGVWFPNIDKIEEKWKW